MWAKGVCDVRILYLNICKYFKLCKIFSSAKFFKLCKNFRFAKFQVIYAFCFSSCATLFRRKLVVYKLCSHQKHHSDHLFPFFRPEAFDIPSMSMSHYHVSTIMLSHSTFIFTVFRVITCPQRSYHLPPLHHFLCISIHVSMFEKDQNKILNSFTSTIQSNDLLHVAQSSYSPWICDQLFDIFPSQKTLPYYFSHLLSPSISCKLINLPANFCKSNEINRNI